MGVDRRRLIGTEIDASLVEGIEAFPDPLARIEAKPPTTMPVIAIVMSKPLQITLLRGAIPRESPSDGSAAPPNWLGRRRHKIEQRKIAHAQ
jgi:hypothetical protein